MKIIALLACAVALVTVTGPAFAKYDCDNGFKNHMAKMSIYIDKTSGYELSDAVRKSLDAYDLARLVMISHPMVFGIKLNRIWPPRPANRFFTLGTVDRDKLRSRVHRAQSTIR